VRIETDIVRGYKTCGADRTAMDEDCPGYDSVEIDVIREEVHRLFGDAAGVNGVGSAGIPVSNDPWSVLPSHSLIYVKPVNPEDVVCDYCGGPANLSLEARPKYQRLSEQGPDELIRRARADRKLGERQTDAAERQAVALERMAGANSDIDDLRAQVARLTAALDAQNSPLSASDAEPVSQGHPSRRARQKA